MATTAEESVDVGVFRRDSGRRELLEDEEVEEEGEKEASLRRGEQTNDAANRPGIRWSNQVTTFHEHLGSDKYK